MRPLAVLDAAAFDLLDAPAGGALRALLRRTLDAGGEARCAAVTLAEVCRGTARTRRVEVALSRDRGGQRIRVIPTDERLAKLVGAIMEDVGVGSEMLADAHVVAVGAEGEVAIVLTGDPDDLHTLGAAVPGTRYVIRDPAHL